MCTDAFQEPVPKPMFAWAIAQGQHVASALMDGPRSPPVASGAPHQVTRLKAEGVITGGMIPKLETACDAVSGGCGSAVIMDGRVQHCTLQHFFGEGGVGTAVVE